MKQLYEVLKLATAYLEKYGTSSARLSAEELLAHVLGLKRLDLYLQYDKPLQESELQRYRELLKRRAHKEPLQYILSRVTFYGCELCLSPSVLIPRQETEIFLDKVCSYIKKKNQYTTAWDLCTGSGALAIGLKRALPNLEVAASDLSISALEVAQTNAQINRSQISFYLGDLLQPFQGQKTDLVICNPPYIAESHYLTLEPEVRLFEPKQALVAGASGLEFYERLARELPSYLHPGGMVCLEIGSTQKEGVLELFQDARWSSKEIFKDWAGHDRFFFLEFE